MDLTSIQHLYKSDPERGPALNLRNLGGRLYLFKAWSYDQWDRLPVDDRPQSAQELDGIGWYDVEELPSAIQVLSRRA